jgi:hypothetical protein
MSGLENLIGVVQGLMNVRCSQIAHVPHKHRDGTWSIHFDAFLNRVSVVHEGYIWEYADSHHFRNLESALREFAAALDAEIKTCRKRLSAEEES